MRLATIFCLLFLLTGIAIAQDTNFSVGPQYLMTSGSPMFARPIATPSLSLGEVQPSTLAFSPESASEVQTPSTPSNPQSQPDLTRIFWGNREASDSSTVIELSSAEPSRTLPAGIIDVGVSGMTDAGSLRERGYGVPLGDVSSFWKSHKPRATRRFTNQDVARLHGG